MDLRKNHGFWKGGGGVRPKIDDLRKKTQRVIFSLDDCVTLDERIFAKVLVFVVLLVVQPIWKIYVKIYYSPNLWVEITIYLKPPTSLVGFCGSLSSCKLKKSTFLSMRHQFANKFAPHLVAVDGKKTIRILPYFQTDHVTTGFFYLGKCYPLTFQGINISHLGKRKIIFKMPFWGDMLVPRRVHVWVFVFVASTNVTDIFAILLRHVMLHFWGPPSAKNISYI